MEMEVGAKCSDRHLDEALGMHCPSYGVVMLGRGAVGAPLPMAKLGCGGWL